MAIKKSKKRVNDYRSHMAIRESSLNFDSSDKDNLGLSDYMDDSVPADVKPSYSLTPMQEEIPIQSKDLFKGLWEDVVQNGFNYWMDPRGRFLRAKEGHAMWAMNYMMAHDMLRDFHGDDPKEKMYELGFVRVKVANGEIYIDYPKGQVLKNIQWRNLKDSAIESEMRLIDTSDTFYNREIELNEANLSVNKGGKTLFIESMMPDDLDTFKSHLGSLFAYLQKELQLKTVPKVKLVSDDKNAEKVLGKTAYYDPDEKLVVLYTTNRHQKDVLRSFAHEIIHHWQHENEKLQTFSKDPGTKKESRGEGPRPTQDPQYAQNNPWLRQMEKQAYLLGNICFRDWEDEKKAKDRKSGKKMVENDRPQIPLETPYGVIDGQTKKVVFRTTYANRNRARRFADKKDLEYGAHRYIPMVLRGDYLKERTTVIGKQYPPKRPDYRG